MESGSISKRAACLRAACQYIRQKGAAQLTLDAVAKEAGVSKGGLLYHFPSKEALIKALMEDFLDRFDQDTETEAAAHTDLSANHWARAYLIQTSRLSQEDMELNSAIMAAAALNPELLQPIKERYDLWQRRIDGASNPVAATVIRLAADGLFFSELFGFAPLPEERRAEAIDYMLQLLSKEEN